MVLGESHHLPELVSNGLESRGVMAYPPHTHTLRASGNNRHAAQRGGGWMRALPLSRVMFTPSNILHNKHNVSFGTWPSHLRPSLHPSCWQVWISVLCVSNTSSLLYSRYYCSLLVWHRGHCYCTDHQVLRVDQSSCIHLVSGHLACALLTSSGMSSSGCLSISLRHSPALKLKMT